MKLERAHLLRVLPQIEEIQNPELREKVILIYLEMAALSSYETIEDAILFPGAPDAGYLEHVHIVTGLCMEAASLVTKHHGAKVDRELLLVACLVHDVSKLAEYQGKGKEATYTELGKMLTHGYLGTEAARRHGLPMLVQHITNTHTPTVSNEPQSLEAAILASADMLTAHMQMYVQGLRFPYLARH